jgi:DNA-binding NtrC family response regulator
LKALVEEGRFRADLYYRLNVVPLTIPPLRERRDDVQMLARHFLRKHEPKTKQGMYQMTPQLERQLQEYDWPGNARELENFIRRALALATGTLLGPQPMDPVEDTGGRGSGDAVRPGLTLERMERQLLEKTLEATGGNRTRAAELMGVSLRTVRNKIREYGLPAWRAS